MISAVAVIADSVSIAAPSIHAAQQLLAPAQPWIAVFVLSPAHSASLSAHHVASTHPCAPAFPVALLFS